MNKLKIYSYLLLIISIITILYCLILDPADWIIYTVSIVFIPAFILSLGLITMANPKNDEKEDRREEPFIGY